MAMVTANGEGKEFTTPCTLEEFLVSQTILPTTVVVEHNGEAVAHSEYTKRQLTDGDQLEIVRIVAGG